MAIKDQRCDRQALQSMAKMAPPDIKFLVKIPIYSKGRFCSVSDSNGQKGDRK